MVSDISDRSLARQDSVPSRRHVYHRADSTLRCHPQKLPPVAAGSRRRENWSEIEIESGVTARHVHRIGVMVAASEGASTRDEVSVWSVMVPPRPP